MGFVVPAVSKDMTLTAFTGFEFVGAGVCAMHARGGVVRGLWYYLDDIPWIVFAGFEFVGQAFNGAIPRRGGGGLLALMCAVN